mmetsp:Transcript_72508/g.172881  ORF Transcript_72508/g.172881 Transcript_72508/m.172881 type:complete len:205 (-) Transcript_72508:1042-1656(-)
MTLAACLALAAKSSCDRPKQTAPMASTTISRMGSATAKPPTMIRPMMQFASADCHHPHNACMHRTMVTSEPMPFIKPVVWIMGRTKDGRGPCGSTNRFTLSDSPMLGVPMPIPRQMPKTTARPAVRHTVNTRISRDAGFTSSGVATCFSSSASASMLGSLMARAENVESMQKRLKQEKPMSKCDLASRKPEPPVTSLSKYSNNM